MSGSRAFICLFFSLILSSCGGGNATVKDDGAKDLTQPAVPDTAEDSAVLADTAPEDVVQDASLELPKQDIAPTMDSQPDVPGTTVLRVDDLAEQLQTEQDLPGVAMVAFSGQEILALGVAGVRKYGSTEAIEDGDKFHLGSCTKAMTATLVARLVEQGLLSFDSTMTELFPDFEIHEDLQGVTVAELLRHEGGVYPSLPSQNSELWSSLWAAGSENITSTRSSFAQTVLGEAPTHPVGAYNYSNTGYMIVGAAIEAKVGTSWEEIITTEVFEPLGMDSCGFGAPGSAEVVDQPWAHQKKNGVSNPIPPGPQADNPPALGPAGTVHCSVESWAKYLMANLGGGPEGFLKEETWAQLHTTKPPSQYALGWLMPGPTVLNHFGSNTMNLAGTWLFKHQNKGFAIVTNVGPPNPLFGPFDESFQALIQRVAPTE